MTSAPLFEGLDVSEFQTIIKALAVHAVKLRAQIRRAKAAAERGQGRAGSAATLAMEVADVELLFTKLRAHRDLLLREGSA